MLGVILVVSGASGSGKTTVVEGAIVKSGVGIRVITCTTRKKRDGEVDGKDYRFFSMEEFAQKEAAGAFVESAHVYGNRYGTLRSDIESARAKEPIVYLVTDVQGADKIITEFPDALAIFLTAPRKELERRMVARGEKSESLKERMAEVDAELAQRGRFDVVISNTRGRQNAVIKRVLALANYHRAVTNKLSTSEKKQG